MSELTDKGIHKSQSDVWEEDLLNAEWRPLARHRNAPVWRSPDGTCFPGPGFAWEIMKQQERDQATNQDKIFNTGICPTCNQATQHVTMLRKQDDPPIEVV